MYLPLRDSNLRLIHGCIVSKPAAATSLWAVLFGANLQSQSSKAAAVFLSSWCACEVRLLMFLKNRPCVAKSGTVKLPLGPIGREEVAQGPKEGSGTRDPPDQLSKQQPRGSL